MGEVLQLIRGAFAAASSLRSIDRDGSSCNLLPFQQSTTEETCTTFRSALTCQRLCILNTALQRLDRAGVLHTRLRLLKEYGHDVAILPDNP